jgi:NADPH2:quinone reductase
MGAYSTERNVPASVLIKLPDFVDDRTAAAVMLKGMTAEYLLHRTYAVKPGDRIVWHAAAGGVGLIAVRWARALGATVIGTVSTPAKAEKARAAGCEHVVLSGEDLPARVQELTSGKGVPVVYDSVGKDTWQASMDCVARRGLLVHFGNASGPPPPIDPMMLTRKGSLYLTRPSTAHYLATPEELDASSALLWAALRAGHVQAEIGQTFPLEKAADAHRALETRQTTGSTLLLP